jgi:putative SOS response-associated peptidase YedK
MCGRYTLVNLARLTELFPWITEPPADAVARYNIAPSQPILAVANDKPDQYDHFLWGLVPSWAKDPSIGNRMINARCESLAEKNAFKKAYQRRRCAIPADGFYEWKLNPDGKTKQPVYVRLKGGKPFALAGLWEHWHDAKGNELRSATIITTRPNKLMATLHDRMPVLLHDKDLRRWLDRAERSPDQLNDLLVPFPDDQMESWPVSKQINNPRTDHPELIKPIEPEKTTLFG